MPTVPSRGPRGYPDMQRVENWDGPTLNELEKLEPPELVTFGSPTFDVGRYASAAGWMRVPTGSITVKAAWFTAKVGGLELGRQEWLMTKGLGEFASLRLSNLGPFLGFSFTGNEAANLVEFQFEGTNRQVSQEAIPRSPVLLRVVETFKASEVKHYKLAQLATGTLHVVLNCAPGDVANAYVKVTSASRQEQLLVDLKTTAEISVVEKEAPLPLAPAEVTIENGPKEQQLELGVIVHSS